MSRALTILLCLLAVGAVVFLVIWEPRRVSTREQIQADRSGQLFALDPATVKKIRIESPGGEIEIKRDGSIWKIGPEPEDRGDPRLIAKLLDCASKITYLDRIAAAEFDNDDRDRGDYGLKNPKRVIEFQGEHNVTLYLGKDAAHEDRIYARLSDSKDVYLIGDDILKIAFPDKPNFRDRRLTDLEPDRIDRFIIRQPTGELEIARDSSGWRIIRPLNVAADDQAVQAYLTKLLGYAIQDFVADDSGDLSAYGITEGNREISFTADGSDRRQTLRLGQTVPDGVLAQFTARDIVVRLPGEAAKLLDATPDLLRDHRLLPVNLDYVDLIRIQAGDRNFSLERKDDGWQVRDGHEVHPANTAAIQGLVDVLSHTNALSYQPVTNDRLASGGLNAPQRTVQFVSRLSENTPEASAGERVFGRLALGTANNGQVWVRSGDDPEVIAAPESILQAIPPDPAAWQAK